MYLPNLDELLLRIVLALPKASMTGFVAITCSSTSLIFESEWSTLAKYLITYLVL